MKNEKKVLIALKGQRDDQLEIDMTFLRKIFRRDKVLISLIHNELWRTERSCYKKIPHYPTIQVKIENEE